MISDYINGSFELFAGLFALVNCLRLAKDKQVKGVSPLATGFFCSWGAWNLYYYPSLGQWASFAGGLLIFLINFIWVCQMIYYVKHPGGKVDQDSEFRSFNEEE